MKRFHSHLTADEWQSIFSIGLLIVAWLYANMRSLQWLFYALTQASSLNLAVMGIVLTALVVQLRHHQQNQSATRPYFIFPTLRLAPLLLMLGSWLSAIALGWILDLEQLTVLLFILGSYGLCGLFIEPSIWRKNLPAAALIACILPFGSQFNSGLGMPARILTANAVEKLLLALHINAISSHEIILLENGIAHVDLPCSGVKSMWTGTVFLLAVTWLENRFIGIKWLLICLINLLLLISANTLRVVILILANYTFNQPQIAQVLHLSLGIIGFIFACGLTWLMLRTVSQHEQIECSQQKQQVNKRQQILLKKLYPGKMLVVTVIVTALLFSSQLQYSPNNILAIAPRHFSPEIFAQPIPLTPSEQTLFNNQVNPTIAEKYHFKYQNISGSFLVVFSKSWQAFHSPELCLTGNGLKVDSMKKSQLTSDILGRWLDLQNGQVSAAYWLQSKFYTTDDLLLYIRNKIFHKNQDGVLVSILFDQASTPDHPQIRNFLTTIYNDINLSLTGEQQ